MLYNNLYISAFLSSLLSISIFLPSFPLLTLIYDLLRMWHICVYIHAYISHVIIMLYDISAGGYGLSRVPGSKDEVRDCEPETPSAGTLYLHVAYVAGGCYPSLLNPHLLAYLCVCILSMFCIF